MDDGSGGRDGGQKTEEESEEVKAKEGAGSGIKDELN